MGVNNHTDLGYIFYPGPSLFGDKQFDVILRPEPTHDHFDPEKVHVEVGTPRGTQTLDIHHPWRQGHDFSLCAGRIIVTDRVQKRVAAFTFGGHLTIAVDAAETHCVFSSPAPIIDLASEHSISTLFANEVEIFLARRRAARNPRVPGEFNGLLLTVDPKMLYLSCLLEMKERFRSYPTFNDAFTQRFKRQLDEEIGRLRRAGEWPSAIPKVADLI